jgi:hypothetical protein
MSETPSEHDSLLGRRSKRDLLLGMACAARDLEEPQRRLAVLGLIKITIKPDPIVAGRHAFPIKPVASESEFFEAAYGDQSGSAYWHASIESGEDDAWLAGALGAHLALERLGKKRAPNRSFLSKALEKGRGNASGSLAQGNALQPVPPPIRERLIKLADNPNAAHLIPSSLRAFLFPPIEPEVEVIAASAPNESIAQERIATSPPEAIMRRRGPRPSKLPGVIEAMRAGDQFHRLAEMTEVEMETRFSASRDTCRKARNRLLSEASAAETPTNPDK